MSAFRLRTRTRHIEPEPGDLLENMATGNRWIIHAARPVKQRKPDPVYCRTWMLEVERVPRDQSLTEGCRLWPFERTRA